MYERSLSIFKFEKTQCTVINIKIKSWMNGFKLGELIFYLNDLNLL